jgi:hypothetical protein
MKNRAHDWYKQAEEAVAFAARILEFAGTYFNE